MKKMKIGIFLVAALITASTHAQTPADSTASEGKYSKVAIGGELLGLGLLASAFVSYRPADMFALNVQAGYISGSASASSGNSTANVSYNLFLLPVTGSLLLGGVDHKFEALAGADFAVGTASASGSGTSSTLTGGGLIPVIGAGYRYQPHAGGFFFRATGYYFISTSSTASGAAYVGLTLGYAFAG